MVTDCHKLVAIFYTVSLFTLANLTQTYDVICYNYDIIYFYLQSQTNLIKHIMKEYLKESLFINLKYVRVNLNSIRFCITSFEGKLSGNQVNFPL